MQRSVRVYDVEKALNGGGLVSISVHCLSVMCHYWLIVICIFYSRIINQRTGGVQTRNDYNVSQHIQRMIS